MPFALSAELRAWADPEGVCPTYLPEGYEGRWVGNYTPAWEVRRPLDVAAINRLLGEAGVDTRLPKGRDTAEFRYGFGERFTYYLNHRGGGRAMRLEQEGPRIRYAPEGVDLNRFFGAIVVRMAVDAGAAPEVIEYLRTARAVETLSFPVIPGLSEAVRINSEVGVFSARPGENLLTWMGNGTTWRLSAQLPRQEMLKIAESIGR